MGSCIICNSVVTSRMDGSYKNESTILLKKAMLLLIVSRPKTSYPPQNWKRERDALEEQFAKHESARKRNGD